MNKLTKISAVVLASLAIAGTAQAATTGAYVGGSLGESFLSEPGFHFSSDNNHFAGKVFAGYKFNQNLGLEGTFGRYASASKSISFGGHRASADATLYAGTLVGKVFLPIDQFNLYALGGAAVVHASAKETIDGTTKSGSSTKIRPTVGVGASYDFTPKLTGSVEATRIIGSDNSRVPNIDLIGFGLQYNIG